MKTYAKYALYLLMFGIASFICLYNLGHARLENWDEAWYADVTRNMVESRSYIVPKWNGEVFMDKPPLYMWLSSVVVDINGETESSYRIISAISGLLVIVATTFYSLQQFGNLPAIFTFATLALNNIFIWRTRTGNLDALLSWLILLVFFLMLSKHKKKYIFIGILLATIFLTKASVVFLPLTIFLIDELIEWFRTKSLSVVGPLTSLSIFVLLIGIWLYLAGTQAGWEYTNYFIYRSDQGVVTGIKQYIINKQYISFVYYSLQRRFFWMFIAGLAVALLNLHKRHTRLVVMFATFLPLLLLFTTKSNNWYLVPAMPFWSILIGFFLYWFISKIQLIQWAKPFLLLPLLILSCYVSFKTFSVNIMAIINSNTTGDQASVSIEANRVVPKDETIVRIDYLYPTTIYYSRRLGKTMQAATSDILDRALKQCAKDTDNSCQYSWLQGKKSDFELLINRHPQLRWQLRFEKGDEQLYQVTAR